MARRDGSRQTPMQVDTIGGALEMMNIAGMNQEMVVKQSISVGRWCEAGRQMPDSRTRSVGTKKTEKTEAAETGVDGIIMKQIITQKSQQFENKAAGSIEMNKDNQLEMVGQKPTFAADLWPNKSWRLRRNNRASAGE